jgi:hypothetical protein
MVLLILLLTASSPTQFKMISTTLSLEKPPIGGSINIDIWKFTTYSK